MISSVKGVVKKTIHGEKHHGKQGFIKGLRKGFLGLVGRPASGVADLTSTLKLIKRLIIWSYSNRKLKKTIVVHKSLTPIHIRFGDKFNWR